VTAALVTELVREYRARTPGSKKAFRRASGVLPGGETRTVTYYAPYPVVLVEGHGSRLLDADGNTYVDLVNNYTALVHGNAYPPAVAAASAALADGSAFPSPHERQVELAELITGRVPGAELVRFTNSGTEAAVLAARLARHATGRTGFVVFEGAYHGSSPLPADGSDVVTVAYNDIDAVREVLTDDVAAVFAEPFLGASGVIPGRPEFLRSVADLAADRGALFVLDEVQSLRNGIGGEQSLLGMCPDITLMGKLIGGGLPIGAVGGSAELMGRTAASREGHLHHSGTYNGNPAAAAAGAATLRDLDGAAIDRLGRDAARLADSITDAGARAGLPVSVTRAGSILNVHFAATPPQDAEQAAAAACSPLLAALHLALLIEGTYTTPRGMINLSTALDEDDLTRTAAAYGKAFQRLAAT
jgi:glutamate-1-semialdehyde 2,1-aminomutase